MYFAIDRNGNRASAEGGVRHTDCICPGCGKAVIHKMGDYKRHHFAHDPRDKTVATCPYDSNKDYVNESEWHIRMKEYFPKEQREIIFKDEKTGEKHIADVYHKASNTVLEFQHSPISKTEFISRTQFHLNEGRRIAWVFDESWENKDESSWTRQHYKSGKLVKGYYWRMNGPYSRREYRWIHRRKYVEEYSPDTQDSYSVCIYTGAERDVVHRIIRQVEENILVSLHDISMSSELDIEEFFYPEKHWQSQEPWKREFDLLQEAKLLPVVDFAQALKAALVSSQKLEPLTPQEEKEFIQSIIGTTNQMEADKRILAEAEQNVKRYRESLNKEETEAEEKERLDREDWWKAVLEDPNH